MTPYLELDTVRDVSTFWNFLDMAVSKKILMKDTSKDNTWSRGNVLIGNRVRVRQIRVNSLDSCPSTNIAVVGVTPTCFPAWLPGKEASSFSPTLTGVDGKALAWLSTSESGDPQLSTKFNTYPGSGFVVRDLQRQCVELNFCG